MGGCTTDSFSPTYLMDHKSKFLCYRTQVVAGINFEIAMECDKSGAGNENGDANVSTSGEQSGHREDVLILRVYSKPWVDDFQVITNITQSAENPCPSNDSEESTDDD